MGKRRPVQLGDRSRTNYRGAVLIMHLSELLRKYANKWLTRRKCSVTFRSMHNDISLYDHPTVKPLWDEYNARTTREHKDEILPQLLAAMGAVQKERGQRTKDRYMGTR